ncbi:hypothetical protein MPLA_300024 [Mesorhizobium sp. ORS 3359]|nr:hypothetical protein MPLA_300024 [Mesorhizobium sp. ORS 3359]
MHGDELVVGLRRDEVERPRKAKLQAHQPGQNQRHQADRGCRRRVLDRYDLRILREDIFRPPAVRMVEFDLPNFGGRNGICGCDVDHWSTSVPYCADLESFGFAATPGLDAIIFPGGWFAEPDCWGADNCAKVCCWPSQAR